MAQKQGRTKQEKKGRAAPLIREGTAVFYDQDKDEEYIAQQNDRQQKRKRSNLLYTATIVFFALIFLVSGGLLVKRFLDDRKTEGEFDDLQALIVTETENEAAPPAAAAPAAGNSAKFDALLQRNADFIGWMSIEGTSLDFPVMHKPDSINYYLRHDFDHNYSTYGVPYLDEKCTVLGDAPSNNLIVYGHNMKTGTIFGCLTNYRQQSYYTEHPEVIFDTLAGDAAYKVFAAFAIDVVQDQTFPYNQFTDMDEQTFNSFVAEVRKRSIVKTGDTPVYGDSLLTLSTCEYSTDNGRFVVCAYKKAA